MVEIMLAPLSGCLDFKIIQQPFLVKFIFSLQQTEHDLMEGMSF